MSAHQKSETERRLDALLRVNGFISAVGDLKTLLGRIMEESKEVVECDASSLLLYDERADELYFEIALGDAANAVKEIRLSAGEGIAGACAQRRETIVVDDVSKDDRHFKKADDSSDFTTRNLLATPMLRGEKLIGVLEVLNTRDPEGFNEDDVQIIQFFADQAAIAIENAMLLEENLQNERLAAVGQTVLSISHYIKNILAGMKGSASLVEMGLDRDNIDMIRNSWPIVQRSQSKITRLVKDMLNYSKERRPERSEVDLHQMLKEIVESNGEAAKQAEAELKLALDEAPEKIEVDEPQVHDCLLNLVVNAIDAVREFPGGEVEIGARKLNDGTTAEIFVKDNGVGIPAEIQRKIFDPFFSTKGSKGTGLGLAVARKVAEEHGGKLHLRSEEGQGTEFALRIPIKAEQATPAS